MKTYNYSRFKAIWCRFFGHKWAAYDFELDVDSGMITHIDKCVNCYKEKRLAIGKDLRS